jgi:hypothetical protein
MTLIRLAVAELVVVDADMIVLFTLRQIDP